MSADNHKPEITICHGPECRKHGGPEICFTLVSKGQSPIAGHCQGLCHFAPIVTIDGTQIGEASIDAIMQHLESKLR